MEEIMIYEKYNLDSVKPTQINEIVGDIKIIHVDLDKRGYCVEAIGSVEEGIPMVYLNNDSEKASLVQFSEYDGWSVVVASVAKYTLTVGLVRIDTTDHCD